MTYTWLADCSSSLSVDAKSCSKCFGAPLAKPALLLPLRATLGILDAGGRNVTVGLRSRSGYFRRTSLVGLALFTYHW